MTQSHLWLPRLNGPSELAKQGKSCFLEFPTGRTRPSGLPLRRGRRGRAGSDRPRCHGRPTSPPGTRKGSITSAPLIVDVAQRGENLVPRHPAASGRTPVRFAEVEMAQRIPPCGLPSDAVFLDVHVKGVQVDFGVRAPHPLDKRDLFGLSFANLAYIAC